jgi:hypothetical protein
MCFVTEIRILFVSLEDISDSLTSNLRRKGLSYALTIFLHPGCPGLVDQTLEDDDVQFCLRRQQERQPITLSDVIGYLGVKSIVVDRFWVYWFVSRHIQMLAV